MFPDFIGIGAQKVGTSWLYRNLQLHPEVWMPKKEVHYFDLKLNSTLDLKSRLFGESVEDRRWRSEVKYLTKKHLKEFSPSGLKQLHKYYFRESNDEWYASLFEPGRGMATGEITPSYSVLDRDTVAHVHGIMPDAKIIFMMRNPIERAWSQATMYFDKAKGRRISAVPDDEIRWFFSLENESRLPSDYSRTLEIWGGFYPEEQIFTGFLEDVHFHPGDLLDRLYRFLGVDASFSRRAIKRKIHARSAETMPTRLAVHLAESYLEDIEELDRRFGGYASFWLHCARRLADDPPKEADIPYPLWESGMWGEWTKASGWISEARSGPLSSVRAAV